MRRFARRASPGVWLDGGSAAACRVGRPLAGNQQPWRTWPRLLTGRATLGPLAGAYPARAGDARYLAFETFRDWQQLVLEAAEARPCGLTRAAYALWAQRQLRLPLSLGSVAVGALMPHPELWAVLLAVGDETAPCHRLLVLVRSGPTWQHVLWPRLDLEPGAVPGGVLWDGALGAVLIDTGERMRRTAPATLRWDDGRVVQATPGFVIEVRLIRHVLWWRTDDQRLDYERLAVPLEILDATEERP